MRLQEIKKPGERSSTGHLIVDKVIEPLARRSQISNHELLKDMAELADCLAGL